MQKPRLGTLTIVAIPVILAIGTGIALRSRHSSSHSKLFAAAASLSARPIEARLTSMAYVALPRTRGSEISISPSLLRLHGIAGSILTDTNTDPDAIHLRAVASLLSGNNADAVHELESATRSAPANASVWADLAAARYEQGRAGDSPELIAGALAAADHAIEIDHHSVVALFNRALALDALHIEYGASRAYSDYLSVDPSGSWANEARERREALQHETEDAAWKRMTPSLDRACVERNTATVHRIIERYPEHSRRWGEGIFLSDWGDKFLANDSKAASHALDFARCIGETLPAVNGESLLQDVVASIDRADDSTRHSFASGYVAYRTARIRYSKRDVAGAIAYFDEAIREFRNSRTPMLQVAIYYRASCAFDQKEAAAALNFLGEAELGLPREYYALKAEILWTRSLVIANQGHPYEALDTARQSLQGFERLHEHGNAIRMRTTVANLLAVLGRSSEAWRMRRDIFAIASATGVALSMQQAITTTAENELANHRWDTAAALFTEAAKPPIGSPKLQAEALMWREYATSRETSSQPDMRIARAAAESVPDERLREETIDEIRFADASLSKNRDARRAILLLTETIAYRAKRGLRFRLADAYVERAKAFRALRSDSNARADLETAISFIENERSSMEDEVIRDSFVGATESPYDELIEIAASDKDYAKVFALAERSRAGFMRRKTTPAIVFTTAEIAKRLPKGVAMVQLTTTSSETVLVAIYNGFVSGAVTMTSRQKLSALRESVVDAITHNNRPAMLVAGHQLFTAILQPIATAVLPAEHLVLVPDGLTSDIPFSAIVDPATDRFLVEDRSVIVAPNASEFAARRDKPASAGRESYLFAGDPAFNSQSFPELHRLHGASEEIAQLAAAYGCQPLIGAALTRGHLLEQIGDADLIQVAAHAVVNQRDADLSVIPLTPDANDQGLLYLGDVVRMRLVRQPVVVLAGCQTATASSGDGTVRSFVFAFLAAGSRAVIGTVGDIDDNTAYSMSLAFHRELRVAADPADALRRVQVTLLHSNSSPQLTALSLMFQTYGQATTLN